MTILTISEARAEAMLIVFRLLLKARLPEGELEALKKKAEKIVMSHGVDAVREEIDYIFSDGL